MKGSSNLQRSKKKAQINVQMQESTWEVPLSPTSDAGKSQHSGASFVRRPSLGTLRFAGTAELEEELRYLKTPTTTPARSSAPALSTPAAAMGPDTTRTPEDWSKSLDAGWQHSSVRSNFSQLGNFPREKDPMRRQRLVPSQSAPMLPAADSPIRTTFSATDSSWGGFSKISGGSSSWRSLQSPSEKPHSRSYAWRPLGGTWRDRSFTADNSEKQLSDGGSHFVNGCIPAWGRSGCQRRFGLLEYDLTWTYYKMRRHDTHPARLEVGEELPIESVPGPMRLSKKAAFNFWENLRPPFRVMTMERVDGDSSDDRHSDGDLFQVTYLCGIDYCAERAYGETSENSTFDNLCHGVATVRIPTTYPQKRMVILGWGKPSLGMPSAKKETTAFPDSPLPIAGTLNLPANHPRLGKCREAAKKLTAVRQSADASPMQTKMKGPGVALPKLIENEAEDAGLDKFQKTRKRYHRIYTPAGGFVHYSG
mmetsp:Transcript_144/g.325  ORF Transcript_144/g.325 Transcript_144/m.325 type:complete len:479 (+) Transcript_144:361-1797(+)